MKSEVSFLGCVVRLIGGRILFGAMIGVFVLGISFAHAQTSPPIPLAATGTINAYVMCHTYENTKSGTKLTQNSSLENKCGFDPIVKASWGTFGETTYTGSSNINVNFFGNKTTVGVPVVGNIIGTGWSTMNGYNKNFGRGNASGYLYYYFNIWRKANPPFQTTIPIKFTAHGEGSVSSIAPCKEPNPYAHGSFLASVVVGVYGSALPVYFPSQDFQIKWEGGPKEAKFDRTVILDLPVNDSRQPYQVQVSGYANAYSPGVTTLNVKNDCSVVKVNVYTPIISFDQETFNKKYGSKSFTLSNYYTLVFSPNLNIPVQ